MKYVLLIFCLVTLTIMSCGNNTSAKIDLVFQANYGNEVLEYGKTYTQDGGVVFEITKSDFFITDVRLTADDGTETTLFDYTQVDFEVAPGGTRLISDNRVDFRNYESITMGIGLRSDLNSQSPTDFSPNDVLGGSSHYWSAWDSYIFSKHEGRYDSDGDGITDTGWVVHTGTDDIYEEVTILLDTAIDEDNTEIRLVLDHQPLFMEDGEPTEFGLNHDPADKESFANFFKRIIENISVEN